MYCMYYREINQNYSHYKDNIACIEIMLMTQDGFPYVKCRPLLNQKLWENHFLVRIKHSIRVLREHCL